MNASSPSFRWFQVPSFIMRHRVCRFSSGLWIASRFSRLYRLLILRQMIQLIVSRTRVFNRNIWVFQDPNRRFGSSANTDCSIVKSFKECIRIFKKNRKKDMYLHDFFVVNRCPWKILFSKLTSYMVLFFSDRQE